MPRAASAYSPNSTFTSSLVHNARSDNILNNSPTPRFYTYHPINLLLLSLPLQIFPSWLIPLHKRFNIIFFSLYFSAHLYPRFVSALLTSSTNSSHCISSRYFLRFHSPDTNASVYYLYLSSFLPIFTTHPHFVYVLLTSSIYFFCCVSSR